MNNVNIKFIISFFFLFTVFVYADDPFTRSLGQPPVVENKPAPVVEQPQSPPANTQSTETAKAGETSNVENIFSYYKKDTFPKWGSVRPFESDAFYSSDNICMD